MNLKIVIALVAIAGTFGLAGCKPKETTLTGQMFIVTKGAENVKLGDVGVLLIEKSQATNFLQKKQPIIESIMKSREQAFTIAAEEAKEPAAEYNLATKLMAAMTVTIEEANNGTLDVVSNKFQGTREAQHSYVSFSKNSLYLTNADFVCIKNEGDALLKKINYEAIMRRGINDADKRFNPDKPTRNAESLESHLLKEVRGVNEIVRLAKEKYETANSHLEFAKDRLEHSPTVEESMEEFLPAIIQKTITDSDGKFSITYPRNADLAIFANAERMVGTKIEKYVWLVNAPTNSETTQVFLSNQNLVYVDPDGYFKIRPVEASQESEISQPQAATNSQ